MTANNRFHNSGKYKITDWKMQDNATKILGKFGISMQNPRPNLERCSSKCKKNIYKVTLTYSLLQYYLNCLLIQMQDI